MLTKEQIAEIESRYNHLKAITSSHVPSAEIRERAMEERWKIEDEVSHAGYLIVLEIDTRRFYLKPVQEEMADDK